MSIAAGVSIIIYCFTFLLYYRELLPFGQRDHWRIGAALLLLIGAYFAADLTALSWLHLPALLLAMAAGVYLSTDMSFTQAFYGAGVCTLSLYCFRGIVTSIAAWVVQDTRPQFAVDSQSYYSLTVLSLVIALAFFYILHETILPDQELLIFLREPSSVKNVIAYELAAIPSLLLLNQGRHYHPDARWFAGITLAGCGFILFMLIFSIYHSIKEARLLRYQLSNQFMEEQLSVQLRYYNSYHKSTENFRKLKHDYLSVMRTLKVMIEGEQKEEALSLIHDTDESLQEFRAVQKEYSDNTTLNAVLQDLEFNCTLTNVTNNAVEACKKVPEDQRFIKVMSRNINGWAVIDVTNAFDGTVLVEHGRLKSRKIQRENHGLGLTIVQEIVESKGGILMTHFDVAQNTFKTRVLIPRCL